MSTVAVIPARYGSSRLKGKPLLKIAGKSLIMRVYNQVKKCNRIDEIIVATDDYRIVDEVKNFGGKCVMTRNDHQSGTDRIWEVVKNRTFKKIINVQGDEPLISENLIDDIADALSDCVSDVVTPYFVNNCFEDFISENSVKIVKDCSDFAMYFSRSPIPFNRDGVFECFNHHIGLYGYRFEALKKFVQSQSEICEKKEKLEQLRFLEIGQRIKLIKTEHQSIGVDVPEDIKRVEKIIDEKYD